MSNRLFNGEAIPGGVPGPERGRSRKSTPRPCCGWLLYARWRDGQARWTGVRIGRGLTGPSTWLGWGGFSWQSVLSLVPEIWEAPSVRDLPPAHPWWGRERAAHHDPPGSDLTFRSSGLVLIMTWVQAPSWPVKIFLMYLLILFPMCPSS